MFFFYKKKLKRGRFKVIRRKSLKLKIKSKFQKKYLMYIIRKEKKSYRFYNRYYQTVSINFNYILFFPIFFDFFSFYILE